MQQVYQSETQTQASHPMEQQQPVKRKFKVVRVSSRTHEKGMQNTVGVYKNYSPEMAAKKAISRICANSNIRGKCALNITMVEELSPGHHGKEYSYHGVRHKVKEPTVRVLPDGREIVYRYTVKIRKATAADMAPKPLKKKTTVPAKKAPKKKIPMQKTKVFVQKVVPQAVIVQSIPTSQQKQQQKQQKQQQKQVSPPPAPQQKTPKQKTFLQTLGF